MSSFMGKTTEQKIIEVATELFAKNGYEGASTREICEKVGANISLISYYFGGKDGLYRKVVDNIVKNILTYMQAGFAENQNLKDFSNLSKDEKVKLFFMILERMTDYFYSDKMSDSIIMILFREQITSGVPLNAYGYNIFKRLLASILDKGENDREVIFRIVTFIGQIHSARILKQFSLKMMDKMQYSDEDAAHFKSIVIGQVKAIFKDLGVI